MSKVYGFMSWMLAAVGAVVWFAWAWIPDEYLRSVGFSYFPSKWWALAIPTYFIVSLFMGAAMYSASIFIAAPPLNARNLITDSYSVAFNKDDSFDIPSAADIPLSSVNKLMFSKLVSKDIE